MGWKVVKTIEDDRSLITAVPDSWEQDGLLFWPPPELGAIEKLRLNLTIVPDKSWAIYNCEVKAQRIDTFRDAKKLEKMLSNIETENEEDFMVNYKQKKKKKSEPKLPLAQLDFNEYVPQGNSSQNCTSAHLIESNTCPENASQISTSSNVTNYSDRILSSSKKCLEAPSVIATSSSIVTNRTDMIFSTIECPERHTVVASSSSSTENCPDMILSTKKCSERPVASTSSKDVLNCLVTVCSPSMQSPERPAVVATSSSVAKYPDTFLSSRNNQEKASFVVSSDVTNYSDIIDFSECPEDYLVCTSPRTPPVDFTTPSTLTNASGTMHPQEREKHCFCSAKFTQEFGLFKNEVIKNFADLSAKMDRLLRISSTNSTVSETINLGVQKAYTFPLRTVEEVYNFESKLNSQDFQNRVFEQLSVIGGTGGKENGFKIAAKLVDFIFTRGLQQQFTWTGYSKGATKKHAFVKNTNVIELFHSLVNSADRAYSLQDNEFFFKIKTLKHGNARANKEKN